MDRRIVSILLLCSSAACSAESDARPAAAHQAATGAPAPITRRLRQALWPEILFDSSGHPVAGSRVRSLRGDPTGGATITRSASVPSLPSLEVWTGAATRCIDCGRDFAAVAVRGADTVSVIDVGDLELLLPWLAERGSVPDSVKIRRATIELLNATCILGCSAREVDPKADSAEIRSPFLRGANNKAAWRMPSPRLGPNGSFTEYEIPVFAGGSVFLVRVAWTMDGQYNVSAEPIAHIVFG